VIIARALSVKEANEITQQVRHAIDAAVGQAVHSQVKFRTEGTVLSLDPRRGAAAVDDG
jgi:hypothetical protein